HLDHGSEEARLGAARLLTERLPALAGEGPLILTGDFNAQAETTEVWRLCVTAGLRDAWLAADRRSGPEETWTDFREPRNGVQERIDWILLRGAVEARSCETVIYREAGGFPSDHHPVRAVLELTGPPVQPEGRRYQTATATAILRRTAARALLVTPADEVLLICAEDPGDGHRVWFTPGGGLEAGEGDEEGLRRELFEETGRTDLAIGPLVWTRFHAFTWAGRLVHQHERFYLVPTARFEPSMHTNPSETEMFSFREYRWWTAAEIEASPELFAPRRLAELLRSLRRDGPPAAPIDAGI
ncbi:MAG: NUDIX domain-containing protein, partial [Candidatus Latescibacterota bacterium]